MRTKLDDIKRYIIHTFKLNSHLIRLDLNTNMFLPSAAATIAAVYIVPAIILCVNGKPHADTLPFSTHFQRQWDNILLWILRFGRFCLL